MIIRKNTIRNAVIAILLPAAFIPKANGQTLAGTILTLAKAETIALQNYPAIASSDLRSQASVKVVREVQSNYYPIAIANLTGTLAADPGTAIAAGNLTTSSVSSRLAAGGGLLQMVTDFGRTSALVHSAQFQARAQAQVVVETRERVLLEVRQAYFQVLGSEAVLRAAQEALDSRKLTLRQITALQQSQLKSTLDVSFAAVLESEAELAVYEAENTVHQGRARLGAAMGQNRSIDEPLGDEPLPGPLNPQVEALVLLAEQQRPDLLALDARRNAAHRFQDAEKDLLRPTINLFAASGVLPEHDHTLHDNYAAAGVNVSVPVLTGGLFQARHAEAALQANAEDKDVDELKLQIARDVREAWFQSNDAFHRLDVTARLVDQARSGLRLAQARYDAGLGSIVELNEAQLNESSAEITAANAKYEYLDTRAKLDYTTGTLR